MHDGQWSLAERKQDCDVSFPPHPASPAPAIVTDLMFLQVPAYPEVFRDGLHTFKLNEQDTDVRAALPAPSGHGARVILCALAFPRGAFSPSPSLSWWRFTFDSGPLIRTTDTASHLLSPPSPSLLGLRTTSPPTLALWVYTKLWAPPHQWNLRPCLTVNQSVPSVPSLW